jgi:tetratricopeptide (TPR) repeat protein
MNAAVDNIKKATELVSPHHQAEYYAWLGEAYASDGQRDRAAEAYERAVWIATFYTDDESAADYVEELEKLQVGFQGNN